MIKTSHGPCPHGAYSGGEGHELQVKEKYE